MPSALVPDLVAALDQLAGGIHTGFRPVHAKGVMCAGTFTPAPHAAQLEAIAACLGVPARAAGR